MPADSVPRARPPIAWAPLPGRSTLLAHGADAVRFVDNFTTAAVSGLASGSGSEAFFTDARGHVLALVNVLRTPEGLWIDGAPGHAARLRAHLDHFLIRERVDLVDASADRTAFLLVGPDAAAWLATQAAGAVPRAPLDHAGLAIGGIAAAAVALDWFGPGGVLVQVAAADGPRLAALVRAAGFPELDPAAVDAARIEAGSPEPADIDARTLPQELGRDGRAISFTKGCYLGQETVARIDALGHVNRRFVVLAGTEPPSVGDSVTAAGAPAGTITSACTSPLLGCGLGLALLHVRALDAGDLRIDTRAVRVIDPPAAAARPALTREA